ncbi:MAG: TetR/AcrR family transcriptional regulator [Ferrimicrobium sp.]
MITLARVEDILRSARSRARAEISAGILAEAQRQVGLLGAPALSLRSVARELGMAPSTIYRYFESRDDLLTALIIGSYGSLGEAVELAVAPGGTPVHRWKTALRTLRGWAVAHPQEYALLYGSPVPGYHAPTETIESASRVIYVLVGIITESSQDCKVDDLDPAINRGFGADITRIASNVMPGVPDAVIAKTILIWSLIIGQISLELFGHFRNVVSDLEGAYEYLIAKTIKVLELG